MHWLIPRIAISKQLMILIKFVKDSYLIKILVFKMNHDNVIMFYLFLQGFCLINPFNQ